jgi:peroxiredoxin
LLPVAEAGLSRRDWLWHAALVEAAAGLLRADSRPLAAGAKSPPLRVETIDGPVIQVHRQAGKVVLVDFMTTTCPSCKQASAGIQALELGRNGFLPVAVAIDPQASTMLRFYRNEHRLTFPVGVASRHEVLRYLEHPADKPLLVPTLVLLDRQGRISMKQVGWTGEQALRSAITKLLNQRT